MITPYLSRCAFARALFALTTAFFGPSILSAAVPTADIAPNDIRGVKWTPVDEAKTGILDFDTAGMSTRRFLNALAAQGINSIVLKVVDIDNQIPDSVGTPAQKKAIRNAAIAAALQGIKANGNPWHVFLWKREWFERNGAPTTGAGTTAGEYESQMSEIINEAKAGGYDDILEGVMPIETNIESATSVLKYAVETANAINALTGNWLKGKTYLFPGAGMGAYFRGIQNSWGLVTLRNGITKQANFFQNIGAETRRFTFVLKNMPSQPLNVCALAKYNETFTEGGVTKKGWTELGSTANAGFGNFATAEAARITFQNQTMGFTDLISFLTTNSVTYPWLANVIYWGDANEGMTANEVSQFFHQSFHTRLIENNGKKGHFTYYPVLNEAGVSTNFNLRKFLFQVVTVNGKQTLQPRGTGWQNWQGWVVNGYTIIPTTSAN